MEAVIGIGIINIAAALAGLLYFRRRYFLLYQTVQKLQKAVLEGEKIGKESDPGTCRKMC